MSQEPASRAAALVEAELLRAGLVEVVDHTSDAECAAWTACDLASMVEGCFHRTLDPWTLSDRERRRWLEALSESYEVPDPALDRGFLRYLWLLADGARVGTMALPVSSIGRIELPLWSLYVHPTRRGRGVAKRALRATDDAARRVGLSGIRIDTHWTWQKSVRFYLAQRMWVVSWKRTLGFAWLPSHPEPAITDEGDRVVLSVLGQEWLGATRDGDRLVLVEDAALSERYGWVYANATMATALALRGWPLIRGDAEWERRHASIDVGRPEGLASKIQVFEALARHWGWHVSTPRIPRLDYPPLGALD